MRWALLRGFVKVLLDAFSELVLLLARTKTDNEMLKTVTVRTLGTERPKNFIIARAFYRLEEGHISEVCLPVILA
ncbi:hypothetical protein Y032_0612g665 [Ancylostoma ceylanicum]|uniref:Secreted protein n=1 Tax=Ancylostoma ceylanicum TaxID=53326 RepID=A0A016WLB6_9BILA|nr:hypothetical protein Y032_0612g665 [Ancylostoma ceylanicum]